MGAGKTTAIAAISDQPVLRTEVVNSDTEQSDKGLTTVALDYGQVSLQEGVVLQLFGTPGQVRFDFMWSSIAVGALGLVILLDQSRPDPVEDLAATGRLVVGIGRTEGQLHCCIEQIQAHAAAWGVVAPVFAVDVRRAADVRFLLEVLSAQIEFDLDNEPSPFP
jgi:signal recognition particle receptor subunit beta